MSWASSGYSREPKAQLILKPYLFLNRSWFFAEAIDGFEFHLFQLFLHLFCNFGLALGPLMRHFRLQSVLSLSAQSFVVFSDVAKLHSSFFLCIDTLIEHVGFFVFFLLVHTQCVDVNRMFGFQLVWHLFYGLIFVGLLWLFAESTHIWRSWLLFWCIFSWNWSWLPVDRWNFSPFSGWRHALLALKWLFRLFFLWFFVLGRHWIQHSRWPLILFILSKGSNIDSLSLILTQSLCRVIQLRMQRPRMPAIRFHNPLNHIKRDVEFLLYLFNLLLLRQSRDISIQLAHLISHISLLRPLLHQSRLFLEPAIQVLQGNHLILS